MTDAIRTFFDTYLRAYERSPAELADLYSPPCIVVRGGMQTLYATPQELLTLFSALVASHRERGSTTAAIMDFACLPAGANAAFATVRWAYQNTAGSMLWETTFTYNLHRTHAAWKINVLTQHDGD